LRSVMGGQGSDGRRSYPFMAQYKRVSPMLAHSE
jgi:hypothetical protein